MAWEKPKTDWQPSSVPTAEAFNRIENNILDLQNNKRDKNSTIPVTNGGTGATNAETARNNLGIEIKDFKVGFYVHSGSDPAVGSDYEYTESEAQFRGIKIGKYTIFTARINYKISGNGWLSFTLPNNIVYNEEEIVTVLATAIKDSTQSYTPGCIVFTNRKNIYLGNDENETQGFMVTIILSKTNIKEN